MTTRQIIKKIKEFNKESNALQNEIERKTVEMLRALLRESGSSTLDIEDWLRATDRVGDVNVTVLFKHNLYAYGPVCSLTVRDGSFTFEICDEVRENGCKEDLTVFDSAAVMQTLNALRADIRDGLCRVDARGVVVMAEDAVLGYRIIPTAFGSEDEMRASSLDSGTLYTSRDEATAALTGKGLSLSDYVIRVVHEDDK